MDPEPSGAVCATCRQPLSRPGASPCVHCLVNFASSHDDDSLPDDELDPWLGDTRQYGHFAILMGADGSAVELGRGAMGVTYRAQDTILRRAVALKVIDRGAAGHPAARERFLREARAAAQFQHPNVAAVSHYGEQAGECYYAMELVEGETLEARVRRDGALPVALTLEIAEQTARALAAAEARGIIHRDLKPTNLMLANPEADQGAAPLVKVIDFGLAKAVAAGGSGGEFETRDAFVGTPAFASPEQFERPAESSVDHRADIYSLGVTMWYALCGRPPFVGRTLEEIHRRQAEPLPLEQLAARGIPTGVTTLLKRMLAVDPAARPQSARELLEDLRRCRPVPGRRIAVLATVAVLALALVGIWWARRPAPLKPEDRSIAVLPFENQSPKSDDAFYTTGVQDEITADLARVATLKVISPDSVAKYTPGKRDYPQIASELGVRHLLEGSVRRDAGQVRVRLRLVDAAHPDKPWTQEYNRGLSDVFLVQSEITRAIADRLQATLSPAEKAAIDAPPTTDLVAYDLYLRAQASSSFTVDVDSESKAIERSVALLQQAIARDPKFTLAYCALAGAQDTYATHHITGTAEENAVDHRAQAEIALQKARRLSPDQGEVHLAEAHHLFFAANNSDQAKIEVDLARRSLPNSAEVESLASLIARGSRDWDGAVHAATRAAALNPREPSFVMHLEQDYRSLRRYDEADRALAKLVELMPGEEALGVHVERAMAAIEGRGDLAPMRAAFAEAAPDAGPPVLDAYRFLLAYFDRDADAFSRSLGASKEKTFPINGCIYPRAWFEGLAARLRGDNKAATAAFTAARAQADGMMQANASNAMISSRTLSLMALIDVELGDKDKAVSEALRACDLAGHMVSSAPVTACQLAMVYAATGQPDLAFARLTPWLKAPAGRGLLCQPSYGDFLLNPQWDGLRGDKRFAAMLAQLAPPTAVAVK